MSIRNWSKERKPRDIICDESSLPILLATHGPRYTIPVYNWTVVAPAESASAASWPEKTPPQALIDNLVPISDLMARTISNISLKMGFPLTPPIPTAIRWSLVGRELAIVTASIPALLHAFASAKTDSCCAAASELLEATNGGSLTAKGCSLCLLTTSSSLVRWSGCWKTFRPAVLGELILISIAEHIGSSRRWHRTI